MNQSVKNEFSITAAHHGLFEDVSKIVLSSMIGSMNFRAVAYARMHLRATATEQAHRAAESAGYKRISGDEPNIDDRADADAAIAEAKQRESMTPDAGFNVAMAPGELARTMMVLREFFAGRVHAIGIKSQRDIPSTIAESIEFQMNRQPDTSAQARMEAIAEALDIDPALLNAAMLEDQTRDAADLKATAGKVISYLGNFDGGEVDEAQAEAAFDALPAQVQYKIIGKVISVYEKQGKQQLIKLSRGNMDAAANYKMLKAKREEAIVWLTTFSKAKRRELNEYIERGGDLPEFSDTIVDSNLSERPVAEQAIVGRTRESTQAASARMAEDAAAREAEIAAKIQAGKRDEPKVIGAPRRAGKKAEAAA